MVTHKIIRYAALAIALVFVCAGVANCQTQVISPFVAAPAAAVTVTFVDSASSLSESDGTGGQNISTIPGVMVSGSNTAVIVIVNVSTGVTENNVVDSVKWGSTKLDSLGRANSHATNGASLFIYKKTGLSAATDTVRVYVKYNAGYHMVGVGSYSGVSSLVLDVIENQTAATSSSLTMNCLAGEYVQEAHTLAATSGGLPSATTGQTVIIGYGSSSAKNNAGIGYKAGALASAGWSWGNSRTWGALSVRLQP